MPSYSFCDTDITGELSFDLSGSAYDNLLGKCFEYCTSVSFIVRSDQVSIPPVLLLHQLPVVPRIRKQYERYRDSHPSVQIFHIKLSPDACQAIRGITDSLFKWIDGWGYKNPEDPVFYRADGSVFFSSVIHEGTCSLFPHEDEDISDVLENSHWRENAEKDR